MYRTHRKKSYKRKSQDFYSEEEINFSDSRELIVIDDTKLRKTAFSKAQKKISAMETIENTIIMFQQSDLKLFQNWFQLTFAKLNEDLEKIKQRTREISLLHNQIVSESLMNDLSMPEAFQRVMHENRIYHSLPEDDRQEIDERRKKRDQYEEFQYNKTRSKSFDEAFDKIFGDADDEDDFFDEEDFEAWQEKNSSQNTKESGDSDPADDAEYEFSSRDQTDIHVPPEEIEATKLLYRKLVRKLHPDSFANLEKPAWLEKIWMQTQTAYNDLNFFELEKLWALTLLRLNQWNDLSISDVKSIDQSFSIELKNLRSEERNLKKHPAWGFTKTESHKDLEKKITAEIQQEINVFKSEIQRIENYHQVLAFEFAKNQSRKTSRRNPRSRRSAYNDLEP